MDVGCTLLDSETPPWLVFDDWAISVRYEILQFAVFMNEKLGFLFCVLVIVNSVFPSFLAGVFPTDVGVSLGTFPLLCLLEFSQLAYLPRPIQDLLQEFLVVKYSMGIS